MIAYMMSCDERGEDRRRTQQRLAATDWGEPARVVIDGAQHVRRQDRQTETALRLLIQALEDGGDVFLFLEDDLEFNANLRWNLEHWSGLATRRRGDAFFGSLYNPNVVAVRRGSDDSDRIEADPNKVYGSQAFVLSATTAATAIEHWDEEPGMQDIKISRLAARVGPLYYHRPSLVQHIGRNSTWGGGYHMAIDYLPDWRAEA